MTKVRAAEGTLPRDFPPRAERSRSREEPRYTPGQDEQLGTQHRG